MSKIGVFMLLLVGLSVIGCTISGEQEESLNRQIGLYFEAHNHSDEQLLKLVGMTHPAVVRHYRDLGDSAFVAHFKDLKDGQKTYLQNPTYRETKVNGNYIERLYWVEYYTQTTEINPRYHLYAISRDGGDSWLFARQDEYDNSSIKGIKRLFKKT